MIGLFAATAAGRRAAADLAKALAPEAALMDGPIGPAVRRSWPDLDSAVFFLASDATIRLIAPLLVGEATDPGVVCVDEDLRFAVALVGGHGGANQLADRVAEALGCAPVVTTASDHGGTNPLDDLVTLLDAAVDGDLAACGAAVLNGEPVRLHNPIGWPLPALPDNVRPDAAGADWTIVVDDRLPDGEASERSVRLVPPTIVVGIGAAAGVSTDAVAAALARLETERGVDLHAIRAFATVDREPGIRDAVTDWAFWHWRDEPALRMYPAADVAGRAPSVAEAASLRAAAELAAGGPVDLMAHPIEAGAVTVAAARIRPRGRLAVVGLGPGSADLRTPRAVAELRRAAVVVGLDSDVDQVRHLLRPGTEIRSGPLEWATEAVDVASGGRAVALVGTADDALVGPALERCPADIEVVGVPGVTAVQAASALLGAPLGHDHVLISLSDPHTPWPVIERRVRAAADGDFVVCFHHLRPAGLRAALDVLAAHRPTHTPVGAVRQAGREEQRVWCAPLAEFDVAGVDLLTTVVVGSSRTRTTGGRMVTPELSQ